MDKSKICVYDTITKKYVEIDGGKKLLTEYNRTQWNIENNDTAFFEHEIQFSQLIGGNDGFFENFREFVVDEEVTEREAVYRMMCKRLHECIKMLPKRDLEIIKMLYFEMRTEKECAEKLHTTQQNIHKKKKRILCKLYKLL